MLCFAHLFAKFHYEWSFLCTDRPAIWTSADFYGRPFVSKLWHDIHAIFSHLYLQSFLLDDIRAFFCHVYLCSFLLCGYRHAYICAQKSPYICVTNKHVVYGVTESRRIRGTELYRQQKKLHVRWSWKVTLVWINHGCNGRVNFEQGLVLIHCHHSSDGIWLPDNEFVGIRGLSLERLCTLFHECWPKQWSIQLEISVWQAKRDS